MTPPITTAASDKTIQLTKGQQRASHALKTIEEYAKFEKHEHYVSYVSAMPAQIINNGLGQTLATLLAAAARTKSPMSDPHFALCKHVTDWLRCNMDELKPSEVGPIGVLKQLMECDQSTFVRAQTESMLYLDWLKKFARAFMNDSDSVTPQM